MLEQIDTIPWATLIHAYGPASDVPAQIRGLMSEDSQIRERALWELYGNIFHQGTRYQAAPYAVPFLYELVRDPHIPERANILYLLGSLALGYEEEYLPNGFDPAAFRREVAEADAQVSAEDRLAQAKFGWYRNVELECYDAVRQGVPTILPLLDDPDPAVRRAAVYLLAWFPEEAATTLNLVQAKLATEEDEDTLATIILSLGLLARSTEAEAILDGVRRFLVHSKPILRVAAALALARAPLTDDILAILIEAVLEPEQFQHRDERVRFNDGDLVGYACRVLARYGMADRERIVLALCQTLAAVEPDQSLDVTGAILEIITARGTEPIANKQLDALTPLQVQALRAIAEHGGWRVGGAYFANYSALVRAYGLPDSQETLKGYLG